MELYVTEMTTKEKFYMCSVLFLNTDLFKASFCVSHIPVMPEETQVTEDLLLSSEKDMVTIMLKEKG